MISTGRFRPVALVLAAVLCATSAAAQQPPEATLFRVFLLDGSTLVSYGEYARVLDRVVLSLPIGGTPASPRLQLLSIPAASVDWDRTDAYAESARAARYSATRGPDDYALLGEAVSRALTDISLETDPSRKIAMALEARQNVTRWAAEHYGYRAADVAQLASAFDGVISEARAATGARNFDLSLVANMAAPPSVPLMNPPSFIESIQEGLHAAKLVPDASERTSLLRAISESLAGAGEAPWAAPLRARAASALAADERVDRAYAAVTRDLLQAADRHVRLADVRGVDRLLHRALAEDQRLGRQRPQEMASLLASLDAKLDMARRLRLAQDQWAARAELLRAYEKSIAEPAALLRGSHDWLEQVRQLAGPPVRSLAKLTERVSSAAKLLAVVTPPPEGATVHGLLTTAAQLAGRAASSRARAVTLGEMQPAWEASSAAAGALMLFDRAMEELRTLLRTPALK